MQHLKLISLAILVASCVFHVAGFPNGGGEPQSTGYLGLSTSSFSKSMDLAARFLSSSAELAAKNLPSRQALLATSDKVEKLLNDLVDIVVTSGIDVLASLAPNRDTVKRALNSGTDLVANRLPEKETVKRGLIDVTKKVLFCGTDLVAKFASSKDSQSQRAALQSIPDNLNMFETLQLNLVNQLLPEGSFDYETTAIFIEGLVLVFSPLKRTVDAFRTMNYVGKKIREFIKEDKKIDCATLMTEAIDIYFKDVDPEFKKKLIALSPLAYEASMGNKEAIMKITSALANRETIHQALNGMGYKRQIDLMKRIMHKVSASINSANAQDATTHENK